MFISCSDRFPTFRFRTIPFWTVLDAPPTHQSIEQQGTNNPENKNLTITITTNQRRMKTKRRSSQHYLRTRGLLLLPLIYSTSAFMSKTISHGVQYRIKCHTPQHKVCLHVVRRPQRPESTEKKRAERKAIIEIRQQDALQDPTLLTDLSFTECKQLHQSSKRAIIEGMGHQTMTEVQAKTFSAALAGKDILARARTGTGK